MKYDDLSASVPAGAPWRDLLEAMYVQNGWLMKPMLESLAPQDLPEYFDAVAAVDRILRATKQGERSAVLADAMKGLQFHSMEFLKLQMKFAKTGEYAAKDYDEVYKAVYSASDVMARYLDGLLLTYIAWPNHYKLLRWYRSAYLSKAVPGRCLEIGPGHGYLALEQLLSHPSNTLLGLDISEHSVRYSSATLAAGGISGDRYTIRVEDAREGLPASEGKFDRIVIAEVLEHIARPDILLRRVRESAHPHTLFFITTVVNIEAVDHLYLYRSLAEVRDQLAECGYSVLDELDMELKMNIPVPEPMYEVALVCKPD